MQPAISNFLRDLRTSGAAIKSTQLGYLMIILALIAVPQLHCGFHKEIFNVLISAIQAHMTTKFCKPLRRQLVGNHILLSIYFEKP